MKSDFTVPAVGSRRGQHSIHINQQYRLCFRWEAGYADEVEVTDYHAAAPARTGAFTAAR